MNDEKLRILAKELAPYLIPHLTPFLDGLKNPTKTTNETSTKQKPNKNTLYLPEIDYLCWYAKSTFLLKFCGYGRHGEINVGKYTNPEALPLGFCLTGGNGDMREDYIFPTGLLHSMVTETYDMNYLWDYRLTTDSRTMYMKGVHDGKEGVKRNTCARYVHLHGGPVLTQQIIDNTRAYWETMPEDGGQSIVTKATMEELLVNFELGLMAPGQVPWHIDVTRRGNARDLTLEERAAGMTPNGPAWNPVPIKDMPKDELKNPLKISIEKGV